MIEQLLYRCPQCLSEDSIKTQRKNFAVCQTCRATFIRKDDLLSVNNQYNTYSYWYSQIKEYPLKRIATPETTPQILRLNKEMPGKWNEIRPKLFREAKGGAANPNQRNSESFETIYQISKPATLRTKQKEFLHTGYAAIKSWIEGPKKQDDGIVLITNQLMLFLGTKQNYEFWLSDITCITTNSKYFEFRIKYDSLYQIHFREESPLKYEDLLKKILCNVYHPDEIIEFQPRLTLKSKYQPKPLKIELNIKKRWTIRPVEMTLGNFLRWIFKIFLTWYGKIKIIGEENLPGEGPFILLANHEGYFDPIILISFLNRRKIDFLTKSTSYTQPVLNWIFKLFRSIPNKRYQIDSSVIKNSIKILERGDGLGIFPEAERTWDGNLLPFKLSTVRLLLALRLPTVICKFQGSYHLLPRWARSMRRHPVIVRLFPPLELPFQSTQVLEARHWLEQQFMK